MKLRKSDLPRISEALTKAIKTVGGTDELHQGALENAGLDAATAEMVFAVISGIGQFEPSPARIMRELGDLAV